MSFSEQLKYFENKAAGEVKIDFSDCGLFDKDIETLLQSISKNRKITNVHLNLNYNNLSHKCANYLIKIPNLTKLVIADNSLGNQGVTIILQNKPTYLKFIDFSNNGVTDMGAGVALNKMRENEDLEVRLYRNNKIKPEFIDKIKNLRKKTILVAEEISDKHNNCCFFFKREKPTPINELLTGSTQVGPKQKSLCNIL